MSRIEDFKITDTTGYKVSDVQGDTLSGTVAENKQVFDNLGELIISHYNDALDYLYSKNIDAGVPSGSIFDVTSLVVGTMGAHSTAGTTYTYTQTQTKSGYTPLGIVGTQFGDSYLSPKLAVSKCCLTARSNGLAEATVRMYCQENTESGGISLIVYILWAKN